MYKKKKDPTVLTLPLKKDPRILSAVMFTKRFYGFEYKTEAVRRAIFDNARRLGWQDPQDANILTGGEG